MTGPFDDPRSVDPALLRKYDVQGPRYTSYPPANHFGPIDPDALFARWRSRNGLASDPGLSLYVHVPFCRVRCLFCGCHTFGRTDAAEIGRFLDGVIAEMDLAAAIVDPSRPVRQVALGGGTPTFLDPANLDRLLGALDRRWSLEADAERSVEVDPRTVTPDHLGVLLDHGFNRFSLGVQDLDPDVLRAVGRAQPMDHVIRIREQLHGRGIDAISFDLIHGLPRQSVASAQETARRVIALRPSRIAVFGYAHVPWVQPHQAALEKAGIPDPALKTAIRLAYADAFTAAGYRPVGMDHYALPADPLCRALDDGTLRRTFMGYTTGRGLDNLGFGPSAISWVGDSFSQDEKALDPWLTAIAGGRLPVVRGHLHSQDDALRQELILQLACTFRADLGALAARFGAEATASLTPDLARLRQMEDDGLVTRTDDTLQITEKGRFFVRNVCMTFDRFLDRATGPRVYSRTV